MLSLPNTDPSPPKALSTACIMPRYNFMGILNPSYRPNLRGEHMVDTVCLGEWCGVRLESATIQS